MRIKCPLLVFALILVLSSCGTKSDASLLDGYYLTYTGGNNRVAAKFNPATGTLIPLCTDPVCNHGEGCPFEKYFGGQTEGDYIYYIADDFYSQIDFRVYDIKNNHTSVLYAPENQPCGGYIFTKPYIYYAVMNADNTQVYYRCRIDKKTGKMKQLDKPVEFLGLSRSDNKYIYISDIGCIKRYNFDFTDETILAQGKTAELIPSGDYLYYVNFGTGSGLYRIHRDGKSDPECLFKTEGESVLPAVIGDYTYFLHEEKSPQNFGYNESYRMDIVNTYGNKIYRIKNDGGEIELYLDIGNMTYDGGNVFYMAYIEAVVGNYIIFNCSSVNENSMVSSRASFLVVDTEKKEFTNYLF